MEDATNEVLAELIRTVQRDLTFALVDLDKIKAKLGIDQPAPPGGGTGGSSGGISPGGHL